MADRSLLYKLMAEVDILKDRNTEVAFIDALHAKPVLESTSGSAITSRIVAALAGRVDADQLLGGPQAAKFELVNAGGDGKIQRVQDSRDPPPEIKGHVGCRYQG